MTGNNHIPIDEGSFSGGQSYTPTPQQLQLFFNYPTTTISSAQVQYKNRDGNNSRIECDFAYNTVTPQFIFQTTTNYKSHTLTITSLVHNIFPGITERTNEKLDNNNEPSIVGELVIKNKRDTNDATLYSCFLLEKDSSGSINNIDALLSMAEGDSTDDFLDIDIGKDIPRNQKAVSYDSKGVKVVCFLTPIKINQDSVDIIKNLKYDFSNKFFGTSDNIQKDSNISGSTKSFIIHSQDGTGADVVANSNIDPTNIPDMPVGSDYYLDCKPTGESAETIAHYNVPIQSEYTENAQKVEAQKTAMNFIMFIIILAIVYTFIPSLYKFLIYDRIISSSGMGMNDKAKYVRSIDWTITFLLLFFAILLATAIPQYTIIYIIYAVSFIGMSMILIVSNKNTNPGWNNILDYSQVPSYANNFGADISNLVQTLVAFVIYPFYKSKKQQPNPLGIIGSLVICAIVTTLVILIPSGDTFSWIENNLQLYIWYLLASIAFVGVFEFMMNDT